MSGDHENRSRDISMRSYLNNYSLLILVHPFANLNLCLVMSYAANYFPFHLSKIDLSLTDPKLKTSIGKRLIRIFTDRETIIKWFKWYRVENLHQHWLLERDHVDCVLNVSSPILLLDSFAASVSSMQFGDTTIEPST